MPQLLTIALFLLHYIPQTEKRSVERTKYYDFFTNLASC